MSTTQVCRNFERGRGGGVGGTTGRRPTTHRPATLAAMRLEFSGSRFGKLSGKCLSFVKGRSRKLQTHRSAAGPARCGRGRGRRSGWCCRTRARPRCPTCRAGLLTPDSETQRTETLKGLVQKFNVGLRRLDCGAPGVVQPERPGPVPVLPRLYARAVEPLRPAPFSSIWRTTIYRDSN
jgi:hypothetical protein